MLEQLPWLTLIIVFGIVASIWGQRRGDRALNSWAKENGYRILKRTYVTWGGKDQLIQTRDVSVYRVEVVDEHGLKKTATLEVGVLSGWVEHVTWDDKG